MSLNDLKPANTKRARATAMKAFERFLSAESTSMEHVKALIVADLARAGGILLTLMDKFGVYLAFHAGARGQHLSRHSVAQYYRQVKCWLLDEYPVQGGAVARQLLSMGRTLEQHCIKRESGGFVKKAVACTKDDLKKMTSYLYSKASCASDYQDAALLCLLWYLFGRASDLTFVRKQQLSIGAGGVFFIRFIRVKTSDEQALSLFPDADFTTCPLLALALALTTQEAPCAALLNHLPLLPKDVPVELTDSIPLLELLEDTSALDSSQTHERSRSAHATPTVGIHALVNRLLDRIAGSAGVDEPLTSHSFRRGGAQHANASSELTAQWIFDRGAWNLTTTNKAFAYVFNTPKEDHQVAKVLSGMEPKQACVLPSLEVFDSATQEQIRGVSYKFFNASHALDNKAFNVCAAVRDVLTAIIILHYPSLMKINAQGPAMKTIERCAEASGVTTSCLLAWSQQLTKSTASTTTTADDLMEGNVKAKVAFDHQTALIERLIEVNRSLESRVKSLESTSTNTEAGTLAANQAKRPRDEEKSVPAKRRRRSKTTPLIDTWFAWYTAVPRGWLSMDKRKKSDAKQLVAFMKLFIADGYTLDDSSTSYKDEVRQLGELASGAVTTYLRARGVPSTGSNAVLKALRQQHREGSLNGLISAYNQRLAIGRLVDPAPAHHQSTLKTIP
jgi:integrase